LEGIPLKKIILALAVAALAIMAVASSASAGVSRYQTTTGTLTLSVMGGAYVHNYTIETNPCDNSFSGTGGMESLGLDETVSGTLDRQNIHIDGEYLTYFTPYTWAYDGPLSGGMSSDSLNRALPVAFEFNVTGQSNVKNHGDYVSSQGGGSDAAHSCIGMPIH
jgi:hypothetical protein